MEGRSPTLEGLRVMFRRPTLALAEIAWRWSFGAAAVLLAGGLLIEYFDSLPVSPRDVWFLDTGHPIFVWRALSHIFGGSGARFVFAGIVLLMGLAVVWVWGAAIGRSAALQFLFEYFSPHAQTSAESTLHWRLRPLARLNVLRLAAGLAAIVGLLGAVLLPGWLLASSKDPRPGPALLLTLATAFLVWVAWRAVGWVLTLSALFVVRDGFDPVSAVSAAARFSQDRASGLWAVNFWFGLAHLTLFFGGTSIALTVLGMARIVPVALVVATLLLVTVIYFALVDWLRVGKLAAWMCLVETPAIARPPSVAPNQLSTQNGAVVDPQRFSTDEFPPEDDILSDVRRDPTA